MQLCAWLGLWERGLHYVLYVPYPYQIPGFWFGRGTFQRIDLASKTASVHVLGFLNVKFLLLLLSS